MLSLMNERQLRHSLALWTMKNSRFAAAARKLRGSGFYQNLRCATNKI